MPSTTAEQKKQLRKSVRSLLTALSPEERTAGDRAMFQAFLSLPEVRQTGTFFLFWGIAGLEPDTGSLAASLTKLGKTVCLPRVVPGFGMECRVYRPELPMAISDFGIQEPTEQAPLIRPEEIGLALVPALCYDEGGRRLGFGGGYYDRWLEHFSGDRVGLCRSCILQDHVPTEPHDTKVDTLITELEFLSLG